MQFPSATRNHIPCRSNYLCLEGMKVFLLRRMSVKKQRAPAWQTSACLFIGAWVTWGCGYVSTAVWLDSPRQKRRWRAGFPRLTDVAEPSRPRGNLGPFTSNSPLTTTRSGTSFTPTDSKGNRIFSEAFSFFSLLLLSFCCVFCSVIRKLLFRFFIRKSDVFDSLSYKGAELFFGCFWHCHLNIHGVILTPTAFGSPTKNDEKKMSKTKTYSYSKSLFWSPKLKT